MARSWANAVVRAASRVVDVIETIRSRIEQGASVRGTLLGPVPPMRGPDQGLDLERAMLCTWVYSAIGMIAFRAATREARFQVKQVRSPEEAPEDVRNHPFELLWERPNAMMTAEDMMEALTYWTFLTGNAYLFVSTYGPGVGTPQEIWPLPSNMVRPRPDRMHPSRLTGGMCIDYEYQVDGKTYLLPGENMVHVRLFNPFDYWSGLSPLVAADYAIKLDDAQRRYVLDFFASYNAVPTSIISLPREISAADFEMAKTQIAEQFASGRRSAIIRAGDMSIQSVMQSLSELQILDARRFTREEIYQIFRIPSGMITEGGMSSDAQLSMEITFARNMVQPYLNRVAARLTLDIAPYYMRGRDGSQLLIEAPSIVPQERAMQLQEYSVLGGERSINELRIAEGLRPIDPYALLDDINAERTARGLKPAEYADDTLYLALNLPRNAHAFISSMVFKQEDMPPEEEVLEQELPEEELPEEAPKTAERDRRNRKTRKRRVRRPLVGDLAGSPNPEHTAQIEAQRSIDGGRER